MYRIVAPGMLALAFAACATEQPVTGRVVDIRGRPVDQALITVTFRERHYISPDVERVVWQTTTTERDGTFSFKTTQRIADLALEADSPDLKKVAVLPHIQRSGNLIVVR